MWMFMITLTLHLSQVNDKKLDSKEWLVYLQLIILFILFILFYYLYYILFYIVCYMLIFVLCYIIVCRVFHIVCWGLPLLASCVPFIDDNHYGPSGAWWYVLCVHVVYTVYSVVYTV